MMGFEEDDFDDDGKFVLAQSLSEGASPGGAERHPITHELDHEGTAYEHFRPGARLPAQK